jgi:hypothetical protein
MINDCLWHNDRSSECADAAVESTVASWARKWKKGHGDPGPTAEQIEQFRREQRQSILEYARSSPEARRQRCVAQVDDLLRRGKPLSLTRSQDARWHACFDPQDCAASRACIEAISIETSRR